MTTSSNCVQSELEGYKAGALNWGNSITTQSVPESYTDVVRRFRNDCDTIIKECDAKEVMTRVDLDDLNARYNSLEVQYSQLMQAITSN